MLAPAVAAARILKRSPNRDTAISVVCPGGIRSAAFEETEACQVASRVGHAPVANVVDPNYTVVATFPRRFLPPRIG